jgi:hypothetical protein
MADERRNQPTADNRQQTKQQKTKNNQPTNRRPTAPWPFACSGETNKLITNTSNPYKKSLLLVLGDSQVILRFVHVRLSVRLRLQSATSLLMAIWTTLPRPQSATDREGTFRLSKSAQQVQSYFQSIERSL